MQTFLPSASFTRSAQALDQKRLGKQRVETMQIMQSLLGCRLVTTSVRATGKLTQEYYDKDDYYVHDPDPKCRVEYKVLTVKEVKEQELPISQWYLSPMEKKGWSNHPAVKMWRGYEWALLQYQRAIVKEWISRGYIDTCLPKTRDLFILATNRQLPDRLPSWLGNKEFHLSHQSNLVRKNPEHYRPLYPNVPDNLPYIWPVA